MQYTRGKAGPVSRMRIEISTVEIDEGGPSVRASGGGVATMARDRLKAVEFQIQGRHVEAARPALSAGGEIDADVRWTGGTAVTVVKVHAATPGTGAAPAASRRKAGLDAQITALFG